MVDRLAWRALKQGVGAVVAQTPRAAVDCNRAEDEVDPALVPDSGARWTAHRPSARARSGLGIVPSRTALHGHLWRRTLSRIELEQRLAQAHRPYHAAVTALLGGLVERFGTAMLIDCHSMPTLPSGREIVLGDRYSRSAAPWLTSRAAQVAADAGFDVSINDPFAGGHIVEHHGAPHLGVHALQIEIDRGCYLDRRGEPGPHFDRLARFIEELAVALGSSLLAHSLPAAAE
jgi:N-formylglutamate amidohydrolase